MNIRPIDANALVKSLAEKEDGAKRRYIDERKTYASSAPFTFFEHGVYKGVKEYIQTAPTLSLNTLRDEIYHDAVAHGLFEDFDKIKDPVRRRRALAMRIMEEAAEMYAAADDPEHYAEEAADVTIIAGDVCGYLGVDWDAAIRRKMEINKGRPWKHGNGHSYRMEGDD